jgi:RNA polymerase sigma-70 factor, ECF subfamily
MVTEDFKTVQSVLAGDTEAYAQLVRAYQVPVLNLCRSMLLSQADAEDAAQETFLKAYGALKQYKEDLSFPAWLCRIASNHCLDVLRKKKRQKTDSLESLTEAGIELPQPPDPSGDTQENTQIALRALESLPPDQRQILALRELDQLSYEQIAEVLKCSIDAVKTRLYRARNSLLKKAQHFSPNPTFMK